MKRKHFVLLTLIVWALASTALANAVSGPKFDDFHVILEGENQLVDGGGTGWGDGKWIYYDETNWWNQWFYDDPPTWDRWKEISYGIDITADVPLLPPFDPQYPDPDAIYLVGAGSHVVVALNWSNMDYDPTGPDGSPPMPGQEWAIERQIIYDSGAFGAWDPRYPAGNWTWGFDGEFKIKDYNPEWVSIDVRVFSWVEWEEHVLFIDPDTGQESWIWEPMMELIPVTIDGWITHECIPEPTTMLLLGFGALALLRKK